MRVDLHCELQEVRTRRLTDRSFLTLVYEAVEQPDLPRLWHYFALDHERSRELAELAATALAVTLPDVDDDAAWADALRAAVGSRLVVTAKLGGEWPEQLSVVGTRRCGTWVRGERRG